MDQEIKAYLDSITADRQPAFNKLRDIINASIDPAFHEEMSYRMIGWVVPHSLYPAGYHANPKLPLPYMNLGNQKNYIALHSINLYADPKLLKWFEDEYAKTGYKLDMGKGCIRFKNMDKIPYELVGQLAAKISAQDYITFYEQTIKR